MKNKFLQNDNLQKGFTLVETLVSISIFTISILGLMFVLSQGVSDTNYAKKKIIAGYLAQEGIEYMRNMRDTYMIYDTDAADGWTKFLAHTSVCQQANGCYFGDLSSADYSNLLQPMASLEINQCLAEGCDPLFYNAQTGAYGYDAVQGVDSGFVRTITMEKASGDNELKVTSKVEWTQGSGNYNIELSETLFKWIE